MSNKETGGRAFPAGAIHDPQLGQTIDRPGMTLRDYFAAKAMASLTSVYWEDFEVHGSGTELVKCQVETAYEMADAMLAERAK